MAAKYPSLSPYTYCADNPVKLVDPNGEEIIIKGEDGSLCKYIPGGKCESVDKQIVAAWNQLDAIYNSCDAGKDVIIDMSKEGSPLFTITNDKGQYENAASFKPNGEKGGTLYLNGRIGNIKTLSHELFHGFQEMNDQGGLSCHNEVEAQLFSYLVCREHDLFPRKGGASTSYGESYMNLINQTYSDFDVDFKNLCAGFLEYSEANAPRGNQKQGLYSTLRTPSGDGKRFLLSKYFNKSTLNNGQ